MLGGNPAEFWDLTLKQVILFFDAHKERRKQEQELAYYQAYMSGLFSQAYEKNNFPEYEKFAPWAKSNPSRQSVASCIAAWDRLDAALMGNRKG